MGGITVTPILRKFKVGMQLLNDPCPGAPVETAVKVLSVAYPEVTTATIGQPEMIDCHQVYSFTRSVGTKG